MKAKAGEYLGLQRKKDQNENGVGTVTSPFLPAQSRTARIVLPSFPVGPTPEFPFAVRANRSDRMRAGPNYRDRQALT